MEPIKCIGNADYVPNRKEVVDAIYKGAVSKPEIL